MCPFEHIPCCKISWDTRIRTRKNRTKTCCVTITPYPNPKAFIAKSGAKVSKNMIRASFLAIFFIFHPLPNSHFFRKGLMRRMFDVSRLKAMTSSDMAIVTVVSTTKLRPAPFSHAPIMGR